MSRDLGRGSSFRTTPVAVVGMMLIAVLGSGCGRDAVVGTAGSGNVTTQAREVRGFDSVEFTGAGRLTIEQTGTDSLTVRADDNILPLLTSEVAGTTLRLGIKPDASIGGVENITFAVTVKQLKAVTSSGAGEVTVTGVDAPDLSVTHGGAGKVGASGRATNQTVNLSGVGQYDGRDLMSQNTEVTVSGTGSAMVNASRTLLARISGIGSVKYLGDPKVTKDITGMGEVSRA